MRRWLIVLVVLLFGCQPKGCQTDAPSKVTALSSTRWVPATASSVVQTSRLISLLEVSRAIVERLPDHTRFPMVRQEWQRVLGLDPLDEKSWALLGVDIVGNATAFEDKGYWIVHAHLVAPETLAQWIDARRVAGTFEVNVVDEHGWSVTRLKLPQGDDVMSIAIRDTDALFMPANRLQPGQNQKIDRLEAFQKLMVMPQENRYENLTWARKFASEFGNSNVAGAIQPSMWMPETYGVGQAASVFQRLRNQMGPVGFTASFAPESGFLELDLMSRADPREPTFVRELVGAKGTPPIVGGLVDPGVLGVARLSVQPRKFYDLLRSLLPPASRIELDGWIQNMDAALNVDLVGDIMTNLNGHAIAAIYGFEPEVLRLDNPTLAFDILTLRATREAVLIPIADRQRMERVLDAWTQASKGKLNRQPSGDTIQYAWLEDGALAWALILGRDHVVFVDSTAAFDHAIAYERSARPLDGTLIEKGLPVLFEEVDRSGLYLDTTSLSNLLAEAGNEDLAAYMRPFRSVIITSDMVRATNHIRIKASLSR